MNAGTTEVRALEAADLPGLLQVQLACYGADFAESGEVFARRLASRANCSLVLSQAGQVRAYLAAYRSLRAKVTPLHGDFEAVAGADTLYLHDMAVHPDAAGQGLAQVLIAALWDMARAQGLRHTALVSVQGSSGFWARHGYAVQELVDPLQCRHLRGYGEDAVYMARAL
ncbi:MAG: GNAT family N-acetyltransferase [Burkholderiaceae bacterium]|nr:GNAT family N-acetyltransferase [Burkholderiaceae bacterium]